MADELRLQGLSLAEALQSFQSQTGIEIVFSDRVVSPALRVGSDPGDGQPLEILERLLAEHDLMSEVGPAGRRVVVPLPRSTIRGRVEEGFDGVPLAGVEVRIVGRAGSAVSDDTGRFELTDVPVGTHTLEASLRGFGSTRVEGVEVIDGQVSDVEIAIELSVTASESVTVSPSVLTISRGRTTEVRTLTSGDIAGLPVASGDYVRAAELLPGVAGGDFSARINVRGGRDDEVLVLFDGLELIEPYHLEEFENALSIVPPRSVERMDFLSGGFSAEYGDRMSAVLDMTTGVVSERRESHLRASTLDSQIGTRHRLFEGRGALTATGRVSTADFATDTVDLEEDPRFWDLFGKLDLRLSESQSLRFELLATHDDFRFSGTSTAGNERVRSEYESAYGWVTHAGLLDAHLSYETIASFTSVDRDRVGTLTGSPRGFAVYDRRRLDALGASHRGSVVLTPGASVAWGGEIREIEVDYDYARETTLGLDVPDDSVNFLDRLRGVQFGLFASTRLRLVEELTIELGVRFDENEIVEESHVSPRIGLAYAPGERSVIRLAWGHYYQSQRANELQVEDGETGFWPDERSETAVASFEHLLTDRLSLRVEAYSKKVSSPRVRYENLFDPVSRFPETEIDRARIAPERTRASGAEILLQRRGDELDWWVSYSYSRVEDEIEGREVARGYDQPHAAQASLTWRPKSRWTLGLSGFYHSGWPTTIPTLAGTADDPQVALGPLNGARLRDYQRLDVRLAKSWRLGNGEITLFADVLNALGRDNVRGFEYAIVQAEAGEWTLEQDPKRWLGTVPILGIDWDF